jgi:hypothetical protein
VIGENGGLFFRHDARMAATERQFWLAEPERKSALARLQDLGDAVVRKVAGSRIAPDQAYRLTTLAMIASEDASDAVLAAYRTAGAAATLNSLWALAWFGGFDKLAMIRRVLSGEFGIADSQMADAVLYVGDSLNDEAQFGFFRHSVGVANVSAWLGRLRHQPAYVTRGSGGAGFVELAARLLAAR